MLSQVSSLRRTQQKLALLSGENFNVFRILGLESREVQMHSGFLGELLNPAGSHGLKDAFLRLFVEAINQKLPPEAKKPPEFNTAAAHLVVEHDIGRITADYLQGGRIDLYLESGGEYIFIENKIYAGDQQNQLVRYKAHRNHARLLYLTLDGKDAPEWSKGGLTSDQYQIISYKEDVSSWLEKCRQVAVAYPLVRETIVQYQHLINYLTGNTPSDFMKEEMKHLLQGSQDNFVSAAALQSVFAETRQEFVNSLTDKFEAEWKRQFKQNLSPLPEYEIYFRQQWNIYGYQVVKDGEDVNVPDEVALQPLLALALGISKIKRQKSWVGWDSWLGWKVMDVLHIDSLSPDELYAAATNDEARKRLFAEKIREAMPYFEEFKALADSLKIIA
ncbi:PD-(D/E)XK nuclease family protein [Hymenobacter sp. M29]|uniref:PD-(D/E)XK nuclease family protein n=1 Tax=Hymenobacter mellowenesis TaxID=3063995 RepID=A0ABT9AIC5_9BACT|nr:PD-(D/E)XK nuclease family protein [Hymenobacter sp. M29]MDO7848706.1 PD-(D/E)XK nuclease family protein [Hymenobacter sp. M29]